MKQNVREKILNENPYDIETFFETFNVASRHHKEIIYIDKFISGIRANPNADLTELNYRILLDLNLL
jgi:hypothetical protein